MQMHTHTINVKSVTSLEKSFINAITFILSTYLYPLQNAWKDRRKGNICDSVLVHTCTYFKDFTKVDKRQHLFKAAALGMRAASLPPSPLVALTTNKGGGWVGGSGLGGRTGEVPVPIT